MAINLDTKSLLQRYGQVKQTEIERLLSQYGTSLKETREMYPQLTSAIEQRRLATTFPTQELFFTSMEAAQMGLSLQEGWMMKMTPSEAQTGYGISFITPQKWEITEGGTYISPEGAEYSQADLEALLSVPLGGLETTPQALTTKDLTEEGKSLYGEYQAGGGELDVKGWIDLRERQQLETEEVFGAVFPEQDISEVLAYLEENPEGFITDLREIGWNERTEALLRAIAPEITDEDMYDIFGRLPEIEESGGKNVRDAFYLFGKQFIYQLGQGFTSLIPQLFTRFLEDPAVVSAWVSEGMTPEEIIARAPTGETKFAYTYGDPLVGGLEEIELPGEVTAPILEPSASITAIGKWAENATNILVEKYNENQTGMKQWLIAHPELQPPEEFEGGIIEKIQAGEWGTLLDPAYIGYIIAESAAYTGAFIGTSLIVGGATGNPWLGLTAGWALTTPAMVTDIYEDLIASGATEDQAIQISVPIGAVLNSVEMWGDLPFLRAVSPTFSKMFTRNLKNELVNLTWRQIVKKGLRTVGSIELAETLEEVIQQAGQNAAVATISKNREIFENIPEVVLRTLIATLPLAIIGGGTHTANLYRYMNSGQKAEINETIEKLTQNGVPQDQAELIAVGKVLETEEGQQVLSKVVDEVSQLPEIQRQAQNALNELQESNPGLVMPAGGNMGLGVKDIENDPLAAIEDRFSVPPNEKIIDGLLIPNWIRTVLKKTEAIPGIGKVQKAVLGWRSTLNRQSDLVEDIVGRSAVVYGAITRMGVNTSKIEAGILRSIIRDSARYFGFNEAGYSAKMAGKLLSDYKGEANAGTLEHVLTHPEMYDWTNMSRGLEYVTRFNKLNKAVFALLQKEGVAPNVVNEAWMHRVVTGKTVGGEAVGVRGKPGRGGRRVGAKPSYEKPRTFKTMAEGIQAGIMYEPNAEASIGSYIEEAYKAVANARVEANLQEFGETPSERLAERFPEVAERAELTKEELADAAYLESVIKRAKRGEKLPGQTLLAIQRRFPQLGRRLRALVEQGGVAEKQMRQLLKQNDRLISDLKAQLARAKVAVKPAEVKVEVTRIETADIEPHVEAKYSKLPGEESEAVAKAVPVDLIEDRRLTPGDLEKTLSTLKPEDAQVEIEAIEATIADQTGDLIETYRYESWEEGQNLERYLDSLLEVTNKHRKALGLPQLVDLTIEPLVGKPTRVAKPEPVIIPDKQKLREAFKLMDYEDKLAFRETMHSQLQELGQMLEEQEAQLEALTETFESDRARPFIDIVAKTGEYKGEIAYLTVNQYRLLTGAKWVFQTMEKMGKKVKTKVLMGGKMPNPSIMTPDGKKVRWEYAMDEVAQELGYESDEALKKAIEAALDMKQTIGDLKVMLSAGEERLDGVKRMLSVLTDVESVPAVVEAEVVEPVPEAVPMPEAMLEATNEERWTAMSVPERVDAAQSVGLEGKVGSKEWADLTAEERDALKFVREEAAPYRALPAQITTGQPYTTTVFRGYKVKGEAVDEGLFGKGTYYTTNKEYAETYDGKEVMTVNLKNPFVINTHQEAETFWNEHTRPVREKAINEGKTVEEADELAAQAAREWLESQGYDGLIARNIIAPGDEVVVFEPGKSVGMAIPQAAPGMPEAGLQVDMFGYQTPVQPKGKGKTTQVSLDDYQKLVETYQEQGLPMPYMRVKPKIEGISELSGDTEFQQEVFPVAEEKSREQRITEFDRLSAEAKALVEARKAPYWQAKAERAAGMRIVEQPGIEEGYLPMPFAGGRIFNQDFIDACNKFFGHESGSSVLKFTSDAASILRITKAALDFSAMMIQGLPSFGIAHAYLVRNPRIGAKLIGSWYKALGESTLAFFHPSTFYGYMAKNEDAALQRTSFGGSSRAIDYFDVLRGKHGLGKIASWTLGHIPLDPFGRAELSFYSAGEIVRNEFWKALSPKALKQGKGFELARSLDLMTGLAEAETLGVPLTIRQLESSFMWFAPNYTRACLSLLSDVFRGGYTGAFAKKALGGMLAAGVAYYVGIQLSMSLLSGKDEDDAWEQIKQGLGITEDPITGEVTWRPTSQFMTIKVGNYFFGPGGFWYGLVRLFGNISACINEVGDRERIDLVRILENGSINRDNPFVYWWFTRASPLLGTGLELYNGKDFLGYPIETPAEYLRYMLTRFEPIWMEQGINWMIPGAVRDYEIPEGVARTAVPVFEVFGWRTFPESTWVKFYDRVKEYITQIPRDELDEKQIEAWENETLGWSELTRKQKQDLLERYPELAELYEMAQNDSKIRQTEEWEAFTDRMDEERVIYHERIDELTQRLQNGDIDTRTYRELCSEAGQNYGAIMEAVERDPTYASIYEFFDKKEAEGSKYEFRWDLAYAEYGSQIRFADDPEMYLPNGDYNWDERDRRIDDFIEKWGVDLYHEILDYISTSKEEKGLNDVWIRKSQNTEQLGREYWRLPYQPITEMTEEDYNEGNIPTEYYGLWEQYQGLSDADKEGFLEVHPELAKDWRAEYRKSNPEADAMLALWGYGGKIQSMEAYNLLRQWGKELGISLEDMGLGLPPESLIENYFGYNDLLTKASGNSAEAKLWRLQNPEFTNWAMDNWGWEGTEEYKGVEYYQLQVKWRDKENEYNAIEGDEARRQFLQANPEYWSARLEMRATDNEFPEALIPDYIKWYQSEFDDYEDDWWLMEHPEFYKAMYDLEIWTEPRDFSKVPTREVWSLYQTYQNLPSGTPRLDFRAKHPDLDAWLVLKFGYKPIEDRGKKEAEKTPWEEAAEVEQFKGLFK